MSPTRRSEMPSSSAPIRSRGDSTVTLEAHVEQQRAAHPRATDTFSWIIGALSICAKVIAARVRRARLEDAHGGTRASEAGSGSGADGSTGADEPRQLLDVMANEVLLRTIGDRDGVALIASQCNEEPVLLRTRAGEHSYCVLFDPLDGISNLEVCGGIGTIFSILRHDGLLRPEDSLLQSGAQQVAAGYVLYGSSTVFVLTIGAGVVMFVLDPASGAFVRVLQTLRIPATGKSYSVNEANRRGFPAGFQRYLDWAQAHGYSSRYVGSLVGDVHRILLKGGVFLYPPTTRAPHGKLRLLYEANPMAMVVEQAGGRAFAAVGEPILQLVPDSLQQRTPAILGSPAEVEQVLRHLQ
ncbi:MAG TPA: class 1 fructose-bisphosphatase [Steroidobacteraceae bacterium]